MSFELGGTVEIIRFLVELLVESVDTVVAVDSVDVFDTAFRIFCSSLELAFIAVSIFSRFILI